MKIQLISRQEVDGYPETNYRTTAQIACERVATPKSQKAIASRILGLLSHVTLICSFKS